MVCDASEGPARATGRRGPPRARGGRRDVAGRELRPGGGLIGASRGLLVLVCWAVDGVGASCASVTFSERVITDSATYARSVFTIDVDGDGDVDALSASINDDTVAWYENDGSQSFTKSVITDAADSPRSVFAVDVDGDGDVDALSASYKDDTIAWYTNDGSESFAERVITNSADGAHSVFAIDVDGDGNVDALSASAGDDTVAWYENDGSQSFAESAITDAADGAYSVFAVDVDGDGDIDALSASFEDDTVAWYENDGSQSFAERVITNSADGARSVFAIDVDGDGNVDALSASAGDDTVAWYENDGSQSFTERVLSNSADFAISVFAIDVDGDGDVDALAASQYDDTVAWYENDGSQSFTERVITTLADSARSVFAADVDADGDVDALSASRNDNTVAWYENDCGTGSSQTPESTDCQDTSTGGGLPTATETRVPTMLGTRTAPRVGDSCPSVAFSERVITTLADGAFAVFAIDVDGDGDVDALSASAEDDTVAWYENDGSQSFTERVITDSADYATPSSRSTSTATATSTRSRRPGTTTRSHASFRDDTVAWYENDGSQSFTERVITDSADSATSIYAIDVEGDGDVDVLSASCWDDTVAWYENDGSQSFAERIITTLAGNAYSVFAIDVDGDGDVDALAASGDDDTVAWYENDGSQSFTERVITTLADFASSVFAIDVDGDGDVDALSASRNDNTVAWYENDGAQAFTRLVIEVVDGAWCVFAIDVDSDGDVDALSASYEGDTVAWYENLLFFFWACYSVEFHGGLEAWTYGDTVVIEVSLRSFAGDTFAGARTWDLSLWRFNWPAGPTFVALVADAAVSRSDGILAASYVVPSSLAAASDYFLRAKEYLTEVESDGAFFSIAATTPPTAAPTAAPTASPTSAPSAPGLVVADVEHPWYVYGAVVTVSWRYTGALASLAGAPARVYLVAPDGSEALVGYDATSPYAYAVDASLAAGSGYAFRVADLANGVEGSSPGTFSIAASAPPTFKPTITPTITPTVSLKTGAPTMLGYTHPPSATPTTSAPSPAPSSFPTSWCHFDEPAIWGDTTWDAGFAWAIEWRCAAAPGLVHLQLVRDGAALQFIRLDVDAAAVTSVAWDISLDVEPSAAYAIRMVDAADEGLWVDSATFEIVGGAAAAVAAGGGSGGGADIVEIACFAVAALAIAAFTQYVEYVQRDLDRDDGNVNYIAIALAMFDFFSDMQFAWTAFASERTVVSHIGLAMLVWVIVVMAANTRVLLAVKGRHALDEAHMKTHPNMYAVLHVVTATSTELLAIFPWRRPLGPGASSGFPDEKCIDAVDYSGWFEDVPQFCLQIAVFVLGSNDDLDPTLVACAVFTVVTMIARVMIRSSQRDSGGALGRLRRTASGRNLGQRVSPAPASASASAPARKADAVKAANANANAAAKAPAPALAPAPAQMAAPVRKADAVKAANANANAAAKAPAPALAPAPAQKAAPVQKADAAKAANANANTANTATKEIFVVGAKMKAKYKAHGA
ncbi:hypothetical protein JL722_438 [Aureococcus anophagefferens]|nr:hypothetical protein JL722_438 [Aureococcus anophagefferens]